ncbi:hypothetical protein [Streptomyces griseus]|nr:hypothetical protein [Streptomyces griseus]
MTTCPGSGTGGTAAVLGVLLADPCGYSVVVATWADSFANAVIAGA